MEINGKISSDYTVLDYLHSIYNWIPNQYMIRPTIEIIEKKNTDLHNVLTFYRSFSDYLYDVIFDFKTILNAEGKLQIKDEIFFKKQFIPNKYPYKVPDNTYHYILWYTDNNFINEEIINKDIRHELDLFFKGSKYEYVWYENPKKTIQDIYHIQVFFIKK